VGYDPVLSEQSARSFGIEPVSTDELFKRSDFITIHTPLTKETEYLLNTENLAKCKKGVRIVNCARGGIIDEAALLEAIKSGHVGGASLDVFEVGACLPPDCFLLLALLLSTHLSHLSLSLSLRRNPPTSPLSSFARTRTWWSPPTWAPRPLTPRNASPRYVSI